MCNLKSRPLSTPEENSWKICMFLCSWTSSSSFWVFTVSIVQLKTVQLVQYLYSRCAVLLCSWTCSSSFCVITVSTVQLHTVQFLQYLYSNCSVLLCSWTCSSSFCEISVSTVQLRLYSLYSIFTVNVLYSKILNMTFTLSLCEQQSEATYIHCLLFGRFRARQLSKWCFYSFFFFSVIAS